jgi:urease accessory protein
VTRSDLLVVNKVDLAPLVGADVERMLADAAEVREGRPVLPTTVRSGQGVDAVAAWVMAVRHEDRC